MMYGNDTLLSGSGDNIRTGSSVGGGRGGSSEIPDGVELRFEQQLAGGWANDAPGRLDARLAAALKRGQTDALGSREKATTPASKISPVANWDIHIHLPAGA
jgi:hypothetical protein